MLHIGGPGIDTRRTRRLPTATLLVLATAVCLGLGTYWGPPGTQAGWNDGVPFALQEVGAVLFPAGAVSLGFAVRVVRRRQRERLRDGRSFLAAAPRRLPSGHGWNAGAPARQPAEPGAPPRRVAARRTAAATAQQATSSGGRPSTHLTGTTESIQLV